MIKHLLLPMLLLFAADPTAATKPYESEGYKPTAIPIVNFSSDDGTGYGARVNLYDYDGESVPYRRAYGLQAFFTTKGKRVHRLRMDIPNVRSGLRVEVEAVFEKERFANYFGDLSDSESDAYTKEEQTFRQTSPSLRAMALHDLRWPWQVRAEIELSHDDIEPNAAVGSILRNLNPLGADGGTLLQLRTAIRHDTRDDYTNSTTGLLEELLVEYGLGGGGDFNGVRFSYQHRHFLPLTEKLVFAHRVNGDLIFGDVPFYEQLKLGGSSTVRGLAAARRRGEGRILANGELRWQGVRLSRSQSLYLGGLLFVDAGQTFSRDEGPDLSEWRRGIGAGLRLYWHSTVVRGDFGRSGDRTGIYITFHQLF